MADDDQTDPFLTFAVEIADGERWKVLRADGWEEFQVRLAEVIGELPVRRRQALMMLMFSLVEKFVTPDEVREWMQEHDVSGDGGVEDLISWLRAVRLARAGAAAQLQTVDPEEDDPEEDDPEEDQAV